VKLPLPFDKGDGLGATRPGQVLPALFALWGMIICMAMEAANFSLVNNPSKECERAPAQRDRPRDGDDSGQTQKCPRR
jgi:hypothetical protein